MLNSHYTWTDPEHIFILDEMTNHGFITGSTDDQVKRLRAIVEKYYAVINDAFEDVYAIDPGKSAGIEELKDEMIGSLDDLLSNFKTILTTDSEETAFHVCEDDGIAAYKADREFEQDFGHREVL